MASNHNSEPVWQLPPSPRAQVTARPTTQTYDRALVAATYMDALRLGMSPALVVAEVMDVSRYHAYRMIAAVRREGRLGRGPHQPCRATLKRGSKKAFTWVTCEECLTPWPCKDMQPLVALGEQADEPE